MSSTPPVPGKVLITGARGFLGAALTKALQQDPKWIPLAGTRDGQPGTRLAQIEGLQVVVCDVTDPASVASALQGCDAVVHCAFGDRAATVDGTRTVLRAAQEAGIERMVHISTIAVHGGATGLITEVSPRVDPTIPDYAGNKAAAENVLFEAINSTPDQDPDQTPRLIILRPTIIYGPGSQLWIDSLASRLRSGLWGRFGPLGEGTCNPIHVDDVIAAIGQALVTNVASGSTYIINGADRLTWNDWFAAVAQALGLKTPETVSPGALKARTYASLPLKALRKLAPELAKPFAPWIEAAPARSELTLFALKADYCADKASQELGWTAQISLQDGIADAVAPLLDKADQP
ncbi:MAG: NAD-dependent epimerase/dehydratase family protein [Rhodospirillaceae bacterium]